MQRWKGIPVSENTNSPEPVKPKKKKAPAVMSKPKAAPVQEAGSAPGQKAQAGQPAAGATPRESVADRVLSALLESKDVHLFHDADQNAYVMVRVGEEAGYRATYPLRSEAGKRWLNGAWYKITGKGASDEARGTVLNTLEAIAVNE